MIKKHFQVRLIDDIVLNASLATEGNMQSLNYIPGSNFLGVVADQLYEKLSEKKAYTLFHSGDISFGDAHIAIEGEKSYALPFSLFMAKGKSNPSQDDVWVHHAQKIPKNIQPKQLREGFINAQGKYLKKVNKKFSLKSAYDPEKRRSDEGRMFGFESIQKGQSFIFTVTFKDDSFVEEVSQALIGIHRIGKSKTAQFGRVEIKETDEVAELNSQKVKEDRLIIYAESNLCFFNEYGQATFQPNPADFGLKEGRIRWDLSQIRTYSYSPWNGHRHTTSKQRDCILKGSVIVIEGVQNEDVNSLPTQVGEYLAEGLGRVLYNPTITESDKDGKWKIKPQEIKASSPKKRPINLSAELSSQLAQLLQSRAKAMEKERQIGEKIIEIMHAHQGKFKNITSSQWGTIRQYAQQKGDLNELITFLFNESNGFLVKGVSAERMWDKGGTREKLKEIIESNKKLGITFIIKFATEMAKWKIKQDAAKKTKV